jgi:hypothetical protein
VAPQHAALASLATFVGERGAPDQGVSAELSKEGSTYDEALKYAPNWKQLKNSAASCTMWLTAKCVAKPYRAGL